MDVLSREKGAPPLYFQLREELKEEIEEEKYKKGDIFLTERQLQEKYKVSRVTVRQAVGDLVNEGYLQCARGVGTIVVFNKIDENLKQVISFSEEMKHHGII
ncbi:MAG: GntR family transcriptional regulator, partial [Hungatella sp.]